MVCILFPHFDHVAIEERFAAWQARTRFREGGADVVPYAPDDRACDVVAEVQPKHVVVVTDPLLLPSKNLAQRLLALLPDDVDAVVPVMNLPANPAQQHTVDFYATLRELEIVAAQLQTRDAEVQHVTWDASDPFVFACRTEMLDTIEAPLPSAIAGKRVAVSRNDYVHRWSSMRGQARLDLLERISTDAKSILEFGCGEGTLGAALKARQKCRVVGIEIDKHAAAMAKKRIDDVYCGDAREIVPLIHETFDWIIGGDIIEHLDDPWTFLSDVRGITKPGGRLLLSIPNLSHAALVADLLAGRFDYVYMGLSCVGHLRFFTKKSIAEMLSIARWNVEAFEPQPELPSIGAQSLMRALQEAQLPFSREDLTAPGYYVTARNG